MRWGKKVAFNSFFPTFLVFAKFLLAHTSTHTHTSLSPHFSLYLSLSLSGLILVVPTCNVLLMFLTQAQVLRSVYLCCLSPTYFQGLSLGEPPSINLRSYLALRKFRLLRTVTCIMLLRILIPGLTQSFSFSIPYLDANLSSGWG